MNQIERRKNELTDFHANLLLISLDPDSDPDPYILDPKFFGPSPEKNYSIGRTILGAPTIYKGYGNYRGIFRVTTVCNPTLIPQNSQDDTFQPSKSMLKMII